MAENQKAPTSAAAAAQQAAATNQGAAKPAKTTTKVPATDPAAQEPGKQPVTAPQSEPIPETKPVTTPIPPAPETEDEEEEDEEEIPDKAKAFTVKITLAAYKAGELTAEEISEFPSWLKAEIDNYDAGQENLRKEKEERKQEAERQYQEDLLKAAEQGKELDEQRTKQYGKGYVVASRGADVTIFTAKAWDLMSRDKSASGAHTGTRDGWKAATDTPPEVLALQKQH
jgi:hypothetical protein